MISSSELYPFYRRPAAAVRSGTDMDLVLDLQYQHASHDGRRRLAAFPRALIRWRARMRAGDTLSEAIRDDVPHQDYLLIQAGDGSAFLAEALETCSFLGESLQRLRTVLQTMLVYPLMLLGMLFLIIWFFESRVVPQLARVTPRSEWPPVSLTLDGFFAFWTGGPFYVLAGFMALAFVSRWLWLPRWTGGLRRTCDALFPFSVYRKVMGVTFLLSLASLLRSNHQVADALAIIGRTPSPWLRAKIRAMVTELDKGESIGDAFWAADRYFPDLWINREIRAVVSMDGFDAHLDSLARELLTRTLVTFEGYTNAVRSIGVAANLMLLAYLAMAMYGISGQGMSGAPGGY